MSRVSRKPVPAEKWPKGLSLVASTQAQRRAPGPTVFSPTRSWEHSMSERFLLCRERLVLALSQFEIKEGHSQILLVMCISYCFWRTESHLTTLSPSWDLLGLALTWGHFSPSLYMGHIQTHPRTSKHGPMTDNISMPLKVISLPQLSKGERDLFNLYALKPSKLASQVC